MRLVHHGAIKTKRNLAPTRAYRAGCKYSTPSSLSVAETAQRLQALPSSRLKRLFHQKKVTVGCIASQANLQSQAQTREIGVIWQVARPSTPWRLPLEGVCPASMRGSRGGSSSFSLRAEREGELAGKARKGRASAASGSGVLVEIGRHVVSL